MSKLINKTQNGFTIVNNEILKNKELGLKERGLLITLLSLPDGWNYSVNGLCAILSDGKASISSGIKRLEELHYLKRKPVKDKFGQFKGYDWIISDKPMKDENPSTENRSTEKRLTDNLSTENITQYNTKKENNQKSNTNQSIIHSIPSEYWKTRRDLEEIIGWEGLKENEIAKDIFEICIEVCIETSETINIGKRKVPTSIFQKRIRELYYEDIIQIAENMQKVDIPILNTKAYILSSLFNQSTTSNTYWTNRVAVDMKK